MIFLKMQYGKCIGVAYTCRPLALDSVWMWRIKRNKWLCWTAEIGTDWMIIIFKGDQSVLSAKKKWTKTNKRRKRKKTHKNRKNKFKMIGTYRKINEWMNEWMSAESLFCYTEISHRCVAFTKFMWYTRSNDIFFFSLLTLLTVFNRHRFSLLFGYLFMLWAHCSFILLRVWVHLVFFIRFLCVFFSPLKILSCCHLVIVKWTE